LFKNRAIWERAVEAFAATPFPTEIDEKSVNFYEQSSVIRKLSLDQLFLRTLLTHKHNIIEHCVKNHIIWECIHCILKTEATKHWAVTLSNLNRF